MALPRRSTLSCLPSTHLCAGAFWLLPRSENGRELHAQFLPATRSKLLSVGSEWAPDGQSLVASMHGSIWSVDIKSGLAVELVTGPKYYSSPNYSPDGRWLIYTADDHGRSIGLEILNLETGETHALTNNEEVYSDPSFSPDGTRVAYVSTQPTGYFNVFVQDFADGKWSGDPIAVTGDNSFGKDRLYFRVRGHPHKPGLVPQQ